MTRKPAAVLKRLEELKRSFGTSEAREKIECLAALDKATLKNAAEVERLHEVLCFMRAYPDNAATVATTARMLKTFERRQDLLRFRSELTSSGIAGTSIYFSFYWLTACWLLQKWPHAISINWPEFENKDKLYDYWQLLLPYSDSLALEGHHFSPREWIDRLKAPGETDAHFLIHRFRSWRIDHATKEQLYEDLDVPICLSPGRGTPSRTASAFKRSPIVYRHADKAVASVPQNDILRQNPLATARQSPRAGTQLIDLARVQMVTRSRDLFAFSNADKNDVQVIDYPDGLQFISYGLLPRRRMLLESMYVYLILNNGIPIGYTQAYALFHSAEVNFTIFDTFRGMDTSLVFNRTLAMIRHLLQCDSFIINTQQLGEGNSEALKTGAFWFYYKHGFRPRDAQARRVLRRELAAKKIDPAHRSSVATLRALGRDDIVLSLAKPREVLINSLRTENIGLACSEFLAHHFGSNREAAIRHCAKEAAQLLSLPSLRQLPPTEREMWAHWAPLVLTLPGIQRWGTASKAALIEVIKAKGGAPESDYLRLFDKHRPLQKGLLKLADQI